MVKKSFAVFQITVYSVFSLASANRKSHGSFRYPQISSHLTCHRDAQIPRLVIHGIILTSSTGCIDMIHLKCVLHIYILYKPTGCFSKTQIIMCSNCQNATNNGHTIYKYCGNKFIRKFNINTLWRICLTHSMCAF
jgi:hypothetical protein